MADNVSLPTFWDQQILVYNKKRRWWLSWVLQRCYSETEDECEHLRATSEETANRLQELATKHSELLEQINQLKLKLAETEKVWINKCYYS